MVSPKTQAETAYRQKSKLVQADLIGHIKPGWHHLLELRIEYLKEAMVSDTQNTDGYRKAIQEFRQIITDTTYSDPRE